MKHTVPLIVLLCATLLSACAGTQWLRTPVAKDRDFVISLEQLEKKGVIITGTYAHPHEIDSAALARLMLDLTYVERTGLMARDTSNQVFQAVEINRLVPALAGALKAADDSQRVRFTSYNRGKGLIFSVARETEGVLFVDSGDQLNVAFTKINAEIDPNSANVFPEDFSRIDPLGIKSADTVLNPIPPYGRSYSFEKGKDAPMWMVADLKGLKQAAEKVPAMVPAIVESVPRETKASTAAPAQPDIVPEPVAAQTPPPAAPAPPQKSSDDLIQEDIKNKLKYLKELLDEGLISQEDYEAKKTGLLEKLQ